MALAWGSIGCGGWSSILKDAPLCVWGGHPAAKAVARGPWEQCCCRLELQGCMLMAVPALLLSPTCSSLPAAGLAVPRAPDLLPPEIHSRLSWGRLL